MVSIEQLVEQYWFFGNVLLVILFAAYIGLFTSVKAQEGEFPGGYLFYKDLQVSTKDLSKVFDVIKHDTIEYQKSLPKKSVYALGGIYYDDPGALEDQTKMRASLGVLVRARTSTVEEYYTKLGYKSTELPKVKAIRASHPMRLQLFGIIFAIGAMRAYPKLYDFFEAHNDKYRKMLKGQKTVMMEFCTGVHKRIEYYCPVQEAQQFWLTLFQPPKLKGVE